MRSSILGGLMTACGASAVHAVSLQHALWAVRLTICTIKPPQVRSLLGMHTARRGQGLTRQGVIPEDAAAVLEQHAEAGIAADAAAGDGRARAVAQQHPVRAIALHSAVLEHRRACVPGTTRPQRITPFCESSYEPQAEALHLLGRFCAACSTRHCKDMDRWTDKSHGGTLPCISLIIATQLLTLS